MVAGRGCGSWIVLIHTEVESDGFQKVLKVIKTLGSPLNIKRGQTAYFKAHEAVIYLLYLPFIKLGSFFRLALALSNISDLRIKI